MSKRIQAASQGQLFLNKLFLNPYHVETPITCAFSTQSVLSVQSVPSIFASVEYDFC